MSDNAAPRKVRIPFPPERCLACGDKIKPDGDEECWAVPLAGGETAYLELGCADASGRCLPYDR